MSPSLRSALLVLIAVALLGPAPADARPLHHHGKQVTKAKKHRQAAARRDKRARRPARRRRQLRQRAVGSAVPVRQRPPQASAPTSPPGLSFAGRRVDDFWLQHSASEAVSEVPDPSGSGESVFEMTVSDSDVYPVTPTENPRAELLSPPLINAGQEVWLRTKFLVPENYPEVPDDGWVSLVSFYGAPFNGPSPWRIELAGDNMQWQRNDTYGYDVPWKAPLVRGRWNTVVVHERFAAEGFVEMWVNGEQVTFFSGNTYNPSRQAPATQLAMATMDGSNGAGPNSAKIMQYREQGMFGSGTIYFGPLLLGESRAAVEA